MQGPLVLNVLMPQVGNTVSKMFSDRQISACLEASLFPKDILEMGIYHFQSQAVEGL